MLSSLSSACDRVVESGLLFLLVFSPLAFGAVHPVSRQLVEVCAFTLLGVFVLRLWVSTSDGVPILPARIWLPAAALIALVALQLLPLPPVLLRTISPATHQLYETAHPGWPQRAPYTEALETLLRADSRFADRPTAETAGSVVLLPTEDEVRRHGLDRWIPPGWGRGSEEIGLADGERVRLARWLEGGSGRAAWRPLSLAPESTRTALVRLLACLALLLVATGAGGASRHDRRRFERRLLRTLVFAATAIAFVALLQRFTWNGKILWLFVPWDWGAPRPDLAQTSGPFVSRNSFAAYLGLLLPLALVPALVPTGLDLRAGRRATRWVFGAAAATIAIALLWSLSRGGWLSSLAGVGVLIVLLARHALLPHFARDWRVGLGVFLATAGTLLFFVLVPLGGGGDGGDGAPANDIDVRLRQTVESSSSMGNRVALWRDSLPMLGQHPWLGVGLGAWGAVFPRYDESPRLESRARRAHNDYLQLACETGLLGVLLVGLWAACVARLLSHARAGGTRDGLPLTAAVTAGVVALGLHELVDFGLQIPAIAVTCAILLGLALRESWPCRVVSRRGAVVLTSAGCAVTALGLALALTPPDRSPPDRPDRPAGDLLDLLEETRRVPTATRPRLALATRALDLAPPAARAILESAVALDPAAPGPRDALAVVLVRLGLEEEALVQVEESIARAPRRNAHLYLGADRARWLSPQEVAAIERGFARALTGSGARGAAELAFFRRDRRAWAEAAEAWQQAAGRVSSDAARATHLRRAGQDLARSDRPGPARDAFERAIALDPAAPDAYADLIAQVLGPERAFDQAEALVRRGMAAGADAYALELALAEASRTAGSTEHERRALGRAVAARPGDASGHFQLGLSHYHAEEWGPAAESFARTVRIDPTPALAWYYRGLAEERQYRFAEAREAFEASAREAPDSERYRRNLARFARRIEENRK